MEKQTRYQIDPQIFQENGTALIDFLRQHFQRLPETPIKPQLQPGSLAAAFQPEAPQEPKVFGQLLRDVEKKILPGITHWQHPRFFAYYPATSSIPAILSELIIAAFGAVGLQWSANPIGTELECVVMDWIARMLQFPEDSPFLHRSAKGGGIIQNTAGDALVAVMSAARVKKQLQLGGYQHMDQVPCDERAAFFYRDSSSLVIYLSDQSHFSAEKAARVAGLRIRFLPAQLLANGNYGITAAQVQEAMSQDRRNGLTPCLVQLNFGSTNTCGYDDLDSFVDFAEKEDVWLHVDAAYAGASLILAQFKERALTLEKIASSFNFNGSKWFLCGFDSAFLFVRERRLLKDVFAASGDYLDKVDAEAFYNPELKDWAVPLGRRFRSLRIWMVIEYFGVQGMQSFIQSAIDQADWLRQQIRQSKDFELPVTTDLGLVCFQLQSEPQKHTNAFIKSLQMCQIKGGPFLVYPSQLKHTPIIRVALGGANTSMADVESFWQACLLAQKDVKD
ncbi:MAG: pyridoxal-dependent decarboxylase [Oligoflexus sp.]